MNVANALRQMSLAYKCFGAIDESLFSAEKAIESVARQHLLRFQIVFKITKNNRGSVFSSTKLVVCGRSGRRSSTERCCATKRSARNRRDNA
jgi:hypothetical protein